MSTYYLKTDTEDQLYEALEAAGLASKEFDKEDPLNQAPEDLDFDETFTPTGAFEWIVKAELDVIGAIYKPTGETLTDPEGFEYPEVAPMEGFHANLKGNLTEEQEALLPLVSPPATPYRIFAGD